MTANNNKAIICVDDEEGVLESYKRFLAPAEDEFDAVYEELFERGKKKANGNGDATLEYHLFLAASGEQAVEIVKKELAAGRRITAGFFDMRMPGGIDGCETIELIRELDPDLYCAVVTAYTDRRVDQIRSLFADGHRDELLYFQKPFTGIELQQTACNMVQAWNRKRSVEEYVRIIDKNRKGLSYILDSVHALAVLPPRSLEHLLTAILYQFFVMFNSAGAYIIILDAEQDYLMSTAVGSFESEDIAKLFQTDPHLRRCLAEKKILIEADCCFVPFVFGLRVLGMICLQCYPTIYDDIEVDLFNVYRTQVSPIIMNSMFYEEIIFKEHEVLTDPLTGLYNRRVIMKWFASDLLLAVGAAYKISVIMIDLDYFKKINDTYGHNVGDMVLTEIGGILDKEVRTCDLIRQAGEQVIMHGGYAIRYGGEEFMVILTHTDAAGAAVVAERIRQKIAGHHFTDDLSEIKITASLGGSTVTVDPNAAEPKIMEGVIAQADEALYQAKSTGRNQFVQAAAAA